MKLGLLLRISSLYLFLLGLGTLISPTAMMAGALDPSSVILVDTFRGLSGALLGVALIDWAARDAEPSKVRNAIVIGHILGYAFAAFFGILSWLHGYPLYGWILIVLNVLLTVGFLLTVRNSTSVVPATK